MAARPTAAIVSNTDDSDPGTRRQVIAVANPDDTILFDGSLSGETITLASTLEISKDLFIDGSGLLTPITISGNDTRRVFHIYTDTHITLDSLTVAHGRMITGDAFSSSPRAGGVLIEPGAVVTMTHSVFMSNTATYYDADWDEYVGNCGGIYNLGTLAVIDSTFVDNVVANRTGYASGSGGTIYNRGTLTVKGSTFTENAAETGGALYNRTGATLTVEHSAISKNPALCGGAGILNSRGTANVNDSTIGDNTVSGDWCDTDAAGIGNYKGALTVNRSTISGNINEGSSGGVLSSYGFNPDQAFFVVVDSRIYNNTTNGDGGGFYNC